MVGHSIQWGAVRAATTEISQKAISETAERPEARVTPRVYAMKAKEESNLEIDETTKRNEEVRK